MIVVIEDYFLLFLVYDENNIPHGYLNEIIVTKKERRPKPPFSKIQSNLYIDYLNFKFADVMSTNPT